MMLKKINITNIIMIILALILAVVLGITIYMSIPYKPQTYTIEETTELFENNSPLFHSTVNAILTNQSIWEEYVLNDDTTSIHINSPKDNSTLDRYFPKNQEIIKTFFTKTHPYSIDITNNQQITFNFLGKQQIWLEPQQIISYIYSFDQSFSDIKNNPNFVTQLDDNWFLLDSYQLN